MVVSAKNQVVISCRVKDYADLVERSGEKLPLEGAVTLQALDDAQMQVYLRDLPGLWAALQKDDALREVARTPLLLSLFTFAFAEQPDELKKLEDLSSGDLRDAIFEQYVKRRYAHEERKYKARGEAMPFSLEEIYEVLGQIAVNQLRSGTIKSEIKSESIIGAVDLTKLLEFSDQLNLVVTYHGEDNFSFVHLMLRNYMAYYRINNLLRSAPSNSLLIEAIYALAILKDKRAIETIVHHIGHPNNQVRRSVTYALSQIASPETFNVLCYSLTDIDKFVRVNAVYALGQLGNSAAVEYLVPLMHEDKDYVVQSRASDALSRIGTPEALAAVEAWRKGQAGESAGEA